MNVEINQRLSASSRERHSQLGRTTTATAQRTNIMSWLMLTAQLLPGNLLVFLQLPQNPRLALLLPTAHFTTEREYRSGHWLPVSGSHTEPRYRPVTAIRQQQRPRFICETAP